MREPADLEETCRILVAEHQKDLNLKVAEELYKKAFTLSFNGDWQAAKAASSCASLLVNGTVRWRIEANDLIN